MDPPSQASVHVLDALVLGLPFWGLMVLALFILADSIRAVLSLLKANRAAALRFGFRYLMAVVTLGAILVTVQMNSRFGQRNAKTIIAAAERYKERNNKYPSRLQDLTPEFLDEIPRCAIRLMWSQYVYVYRADGTHMLIWLVIPPRGKRVYYFEEGLWRAWTKGAEPPPPKSK